MVFNMLRGLVRRFSTSLPRCSKLYELRVYSFKPGNTKKFIDTSMVALPIRFSHSPVLGYFFSEIGGLGETVHIWEYDSYAQRAGKRADLAADADWVTKASPMISQLEKQENLTMRLFPWSTVQKDVKPGGVFFLYSFTFLPTVTPEQISELLQNTIKDADLTALGVWREELGKNPHRNAYAVFHSPDFDSAKNPALSSPEAWANLNQNTSSIHGRLLSPAAWSAPWK